eukprot:3936644-Rhodomonas_salina.1
MARRVGGCAGWYRSRGELGEEATFESGESLPGTTATAHLSTECRAVLPISVPSTEQYRHSRSQYRVQNSPSTTAPPYPSTECRAVCRTSHSACLCSSGARAYVSTGHRLGQPTDAYKRAPVP